MNSKGLIRMGVVVAFIGSCLIAGTAAAAVRDVQIRQVDTQARVVTLFNFSNDDQPLDTYRICTADDDESFRYVSGGLAGRVIEGGTEFRIHYNNDAPKNDPDAVNVVDLGGFRATPLDNGPYGFALYWTTPFSQAGNMADYVQWTDDLDNPGNATADARAGTAVSGGLWTGIADWVVTDPDTITITLTDDTGRELHGPDDYEVEGAGEPCPADLNMSGDVGFSDLLILLSDWACEGGDCPGDVDGDGDTDFNDLLLLLAAWGPCP